VLTVSRHALDFCVSVVGAPFQQTRLLGTRRLFTRHSQLGYRYLPTLRPRPFSPSLLSPNICPYAVWGKARMEVRSRRSTVAARSPPDAAQPLAARDLLSPPARRSTAPTRQSDLDTIHPPGNIPLFRCQFLKTSLANQPSAPHELLTNTDFSKNVYCGLRSFPFCTLLREEDSGVMRWVVEGACPRAPSEAQ
jgi:hypothetical protein